MIIDVVYKLCFFSEVKNITGGLNDCVTVVGGVLDSEGGRLITTGMDLIDPAVDIALRTSKDPLKLFDKLNQAQVFKANQILGNLGTAFQLVGSAQVVSNILSDAATGQANIGNASDTLVNIAGYTPAKLLFMPAQLATLAADVLNEGSVAATLATTIENAQKTQSGFLTRIDQLATSIARGQITGEAAQATSARDVSQLKSELERRSDAYRD